ncbi:armadillo repeat-containing protein 3-like isoform X1 [Branchiostoma lanceolatum]
MGKKVKKEVEPPPKDVFDPVGVESKKAQTVVLMLSSPEEEVLSKACEAVYKFSEKCEENRSTMLELGAVEPLFRLLSNEDKLVRRNACMAFGVLAEHVEVRKVMRKIECIPAVLSLLAPEEDTICHEFASLCISNMAQEFTNKVIIFEQSGLDSLIRLMASPDPDVQKNSTEALCRLVDDFHSRAAIRELGGVPPLLDLLKSEYPAIQLVALDTLTKITLDAETRVTLREAEGLERLIEFLGTKEFDDLHVNALYVLSNCLEDAESILELQGTGGLQRLMQFTAETTIPDVQQYAAKSISRATKYAENWKMFHENEVEKALVTLLGADSASVQVAAAQAISAISEHMGSKDAFCKVEEGKGMELLVKLLGSENGDVKEAAALAVSNLTMVHPSNCLEVVEHSGIEPLVHLIADQKDGAVANAAVALTNLAGDEIIRMEAVRMGVVPALIQPLKSSNSQVVSKVCLALAAFMCDSDARSELRSNGGLESLIKHLNSDNDDVRRAAAWAVLVCGGDPPTVTDICKLGGLEILQEINQSVSRQNKFTQAAMDKLLDSNLPAKFALTSYLGPDNCITDGFFDAGPLRPDSRFMSLDELSTREVNEKRPILLVNVHPHEQHSSQPPEVESKTESKAANQKPSKKELAKGKSKASKEKEEKQKEEEMQLLQLILQQQEGEGGSYHPPMDHALYEYIGEVSSKIRPMPTTREQVVALARFVAHKMGGPVERGKLSTFSYELPISQMKYELKSNILPIGRIKTGIHYHRALLFKALADRIAVPCSLVRGEYNRAWNEVVLTVDDTANGAKYPPKLFIVDLMHIPGRLMEGDSSEAVQYKKL